MNYTQPQIMLLKGDFGVVRKKYFLFKGKDNIKIYM
jgi:hypothetical protein